MCGTLRTPVFDLPVKKLGTLNVKNEWTESTPLLSVCMYGQVCMCVYIYVHTYD